MHIRWDVHWLCGLAGCNPDPDPYNCGECTRCGAGYYDYGFVHAYESLAAPLYLLRHWLRAIARRLMTKRSCEVCGKPLSYWQDYHCRNPQCAEEWMPF